eukprot:3433237-Amphidinium_carterae.2
MSESPDLSGKRKWISEQRADPPPGAQSKAKTRILGIHNERTTNKHVVDMNDTPALWPARMKKALMTNEVGDSQCKVCNACSHDLRVLIDHDTSRHFNRHSRCHAEL